MSLTVSPGLIEQAQRGEIDDAAAAYQEFITARSQILNQRPYLINC